MPETHSQTPSPRCRYATGFALLAATLPGVLLADERDVFFDTSAAGVSRTAEWGLDTAWHDENNIRRGAIYMGTENVDTVRVSFTPDFAVVNGDLQAGAPTDYVNRSISWVNQWANPGTTLYLNESRAVNEEMDASYRLPNGQINPVTWAELLDVTTREYQELGRTVVSVAPVNEVDNRWGDSTPETHYAILGEALNYPRLDALRLAVCTLNTDVGLDPWYNTNQARLDEGITHQLAGSFNNYANYFQTVRANGDHASNDELHNVMEAMVGVEYGMQTGIWWGTAERARGEFVKASDGVRIGYGEHRDNWTAASVYRDPGGKVQAFVGESERQALPTSYRFFATDRDVFFDGHGPQRAYTLQTTGGPGYQTEAHRGTERVVNITWGDDIQPVLDGRYVIVNRNSGKVLEVENASANNGANIRQNTYTGSTYQQWDVNPLPYDFGGDYSYFRIKAAHSGKMMELNGASYADGGNVGQWEENTLPWQIGWQQWFFEYAGDGYFHIRNRWSGKHLDVTGNSTANGANVVQMAGSGGIDQQWRLIPAGADVEFVAPAAPTGLVATANAASVTLNWNANGETDLGGYTIFRSTTSGGPYDTIARGVTGTTFTDKSANQTVPYHYVVRAVDRSLNRSAYSAQASATPTGTNALVAHYAFDGNGNDAAGNANTATFTGPAVYGAGRVGSTAAVLDGSTYVNLPPDVANFAQITIAGWVYWNGGSNWQRLFDFGNGTGQFMFLTPNTGGGMRFAIRNNGPEQQLNTTALTPNVWTHVAVTIAGNGAANLYVNGTSVASANFTIKPSDFKPAANAIGRSQFDVDPLFRGRVDDFRIYNHALPSGQVATLAAAAPANPTEPVVHLKFNETTGTTAADSTGNGWNATLVNAPTWISGKLDHAVNLPATSNQHVTLPTGVAHGLSDFTVSTWVKVTAHNAWARIFDFGTSTTPGATQGAYMYLVASNGAVPRFAITTSGYLNEQSIVGTTPLATGTWAHVAVTRTGNTGRLYVNGAEVGSNIAMTLTPASLGLTTNNFLGRAQYAVDPYLNGALDDFRIYARALNAGEIGTLASAATNHSPAFASNPLAKADATVGVTYSATLAGDATDSDAGDTITYSKTSGPVWLTVAADGVLGGTPPTGSEGLNSFTVRATDNGGFFAETTLNLHVNSGQPAVYLKMDEASGATTADDSGNGWTGTLVNGPVRTTGMLNRAVNFDGSNDHVTLPAGVVNSINDCTISFWARVSSLSAWSRIFDFGTGTGNYMFLTLSGPTGNPRFAIRSGDIGEQVIDSSSAFPLNAWAHVAVTMSGNTATLYLNGAAVGSNSAVMLKPLSLGNTTQNYLGRSQFTGDSYFAGRIDEFQIRDRALTVAEIGDLANPPSAPTGLVATAGESQISLSWSAVANATGYKVKRSTVTGGPYTTIASNLTGLAYNDPGLTPGTTYYYVVTALETVAESATSAQASAVPLTALEAWRQTHFGTTSNTGDAADGADPDGDGWTNAQEFVSGTDPNDRNSVLRVSSMEKSGADMVLTFPSVVGKTYRVEFSNSLGMEAPWQAVLTNGTPATGIAGTGNPIQVTDTGGGLEPRRFYRIMVSSP